MNKEDVKRFIDSKITDVIIKVIEGTGHEIKHIILIGYIEELPSIVAQSENSEQDIVKEIDISYQCMRKYFAEKEYLEMPATLNYKVKFVEPEEFFKDQKTNGNNDRSA